MGDILIIEPHERIAEVLSRLLQPLEHPVVTVTELAGACDHLDAAEVAVVVCDVTNGGVELLREIHRTQRPTRVILTSLLPTRSTVLTALRLGAFRVLKKPLGARHFRGAVEAALAATTVSA